MQFVLLLEMIDEPRAPLFHRHDFSEIFVRHYLGLILYIPFAVSVDADGRYFIFVSIQRGYYRCSGAKRNIMFA
jgi:hypothetical protein